MTSAQKCSFFPQDPYYIPGYSGFYPQVRYQVGNTYGRTTNYALTDPQVHKSPVSVLAPLTTPRFIEDYSRRKVPPCDRMDQYQRYIPGYSGFVPFYTCFPLPGIEPRAPGPRTTPVAEPHSRVPNLDANTAQLLEQRRHTPCHPGVRLACGPGWRQFANTAGSNLVSLGGDRKVLCHPDIPLVCGQQERSGPCHTDIAVSCGQGWSEVPSMRGIDPEHQPTRIEAVPLPPATETVDVKRCGRTPKLDVPNLIQRKAISGYTGFIPRFTWIMGVSYLKGVKEAMRDFDRNQEMMRSPIYSFGKRLPHTYWPNTKIYNSNGLMPFYTGFVPTVRHNYALTFGNGTRKAYYDELLRRQNAG